MITETCEICGRSNKKTRYSVEYDSILCDSCLLMVKKHPVIYCPPKGEIHYDKDGNILCHICGRGFKKLSEHLKFKHHISTSEYKEKFSLNRTAKLTGKNFIPNITIDVSENRNCTQFKVGHKHSKKERRLQAKLNRNKDK